MVDSTPCAKSNSKFHSVVCLLLFCFKAQNSRNKKKHFYSHRSDNCPVLCSNITLNTTRHAKKKVKFRSQMKRAKILNLSFSFVLFIFLQKKKQQETNFRSFFVLLIFLFFLRNSNGEFVHYTSCNIYVFFFFLLFPYEHNTTE